MVFSGFQRGGYLGPNGSSNPTQNKHFTGGKFNLDRSGKSLFGVAEHYLQGLNQEKVPGALNFLIILIFD